MTNYKVERGILIDIINIEPNPWNPNKTSERQQEAITESLNAYGQIIELLVRPHPEKKGKYQIIDGEHRLVSLSSKEQKVFVNIIHGLPNAEAKKLTIILNETRGSADKIELAKLLEDINNDLGIETIIGLPYSSNELDELIKLADIDWDNFAKGDDSDEFDENDPTTDPSELITVVAKISPDVMEKAQDVYNLVSEEMKGLNKDKAIAWGQVLESLVINYLGLSE
jgi:hypothetical protein